MPDEGKWAATRTINKSLIVKYILTIEYFFLFLFFTSITTVSSAQPLGSSSNLLLVLTAKSLEGSKDFQSRMKRNGYLSKPVLVLGNYGIKAVQAGVQMLTGVEQVLKRQFRIGATAALTGTQATSGTDNRIRLTVASCLHQQMSGAQAQLNQMKSKLSKYKLISRNSDLMSPDVKPNNWHIKSFLHLLEHEVNIQSERAKKTLILSMTP